MKKSYDFLPVSFYDLAALETWFGDQSAKGRHLLSLRTMATFARGEPRRAVYRVECCPKENAFSEEQRALYEEFGWEYVCKVRKLFSVWRSYEENPQELHTDPVVEAELLEPLYQKRKEMVSVSILLMVVSLIMLGIAMFSHPQPLLYTVQYGGASTQLMLLVVYGNLIWQLLRDSVVSGRLLRRMKEGVPRTHRRKLNWVELYLQKIVLGVACVGVVLSCLSLFWMLGAKRINLQDYDGPLPVVTLAEMENDPTLEMDYSLSPWGDGTISRSHIRLRSSSLAAVQMEITEDGQVPAQSWKDSSSTYSPSLQTNYTRLRWGFGFLAKPLLQEMVEDNMEYVLYDSVTLTELRDTPFDQAYLLRRSEESQILLARMGSRVIEVRYYGYADLTTQVENIVQEMTAFELEKS